MHYFIDYNNLPSQNISDSFGPNNSDASNIYNITSQFQLSAPTKAFACQDGMMIIQQSSENINLINIILKPIKGLKIPFNGVKYYIYRGISKDSFIMGTVIKTIVQAPSNSFLERFWVEVEKYKTDMDLPDLPEPTPKVFGFDDTLDNTLELEKIYDNSQPDTRAIYVKEGEWIGNFGIQGKIGFEIIMETDNFNIPDFNNQIDLSYLRKVGHAIDVTGLTGFEKRAKQELILSYIDPCAFFGLHYETGIDISVFTENNKTLERKKKNDLYTLLLDKFATKNRVYLDIRSEKGYSYNCYQNYKNTTNKNIKIGNSTTTPLEQIYETNGWPIVSIDTPVTTNSDINDIKINLRIDDNIKPLLFFENEDIIGSSNTCFLDETRILNGTNVDWSKNINLFFPNTGTGTSKNNVAYYLKLYYFRQEYNIASPSTVLKNECYFDATFCPIDLPNIAETNYLFKQVINSDLNYTRGLLPNMTDDFSYVAETGAQWDDNRILFYNKAVFKNYRTGVFFDSTSNSNSNSNLGFNLQGDFNKMSFLSKDIQLNKNTFQEIISSGVYQTIKVLDIIKNNGFPNTYEDLLCFGITQTEFTTLKNITGFTNKHHRYIYIQEITGSPFEDKDEKRFRKYEVKVQGLDNTGSRLIITPTNPIYIYTENGLVFASKDFAEQEINQQTETYQRNYEEKIGLNLRPNSTKNYEDYFIEDINPNMKVEVDGFINALATIANDANAYFNIKTLVEDNAKDIWNEAVSFVQANDNTTPDDRPLYWARIKMQVALKSHPYFIEQHAYSSNIKGNEVNTGSDLEKLIRIFEEKSRNYKEVDFSLAPVGAKKILITGFDPFFLNEKLYPNWHNIEQSNPSGCVALALHNSLTQNEIGYIQSMIVPVRYTDFDNSKNISNGQGIGIIEKYIKPLLDEVDMVITISQAGPNDYNIDIFATLSRGGTIDNMNFTRIKGSKSVNVSSIETIVTTLPDKFTQGSSIAVFNGEYQITENSTQLIATKSNYPNSKIFNGPGGNYLSNEIFYRVSKLREEWIKSKLPNIVAKATGHFHIAMLQSGSADYNSANGTTKYFVNSSTKVLINKVKTSINEGITGI